MLPMPATIDWSSSATLIGMRRDGQRVRRGDRRSVAGSRASGPSASSPASPAAHNETTDRARGSSSARRPPSSNARTARTERRQGTGSRERASRRSCGSGRRARDHSPGGSAATCRAAPPRSRGRPPANGRPGRGGRDAAPGGARSHSLWSGRPRRRARRIAAPVRPREARAWEHDCWLLVAAC